MTAGAINLFNMGWIIRDLWWNYKQNTSFFQNYVIYGVKLSPHQTEETRRKRPYPRLELVGIIVLGAGIED